jgi:predicted metal-dependent enzyme (double-stranded beta helix superfamily)
VSTRVPPRRLIEFVRFFAAEIECGKYPYVEFDEDDRWHQRIYRDPRVDVWLISWLPSQSTELHDHGGSSGVFTVLSGELSEAVLNAPFDRRTRETARLREMVRPTGATVCFGPHYIHDVRNLGDAPAVSVHAYSPPLSSMNYYDVDESGPVPIHTLYTDDPEPAVRVAG